MTFIAAFDSDCELCDAPVEHGQEARMLDYEKGLVAHIRCPEAFRPVSVCARCWTTECL